MRDSEGNFVNLTLLFQNQFLFGECPPVGKIQNRSERRESERMEKICVAVRVRPHVTHETSSSTYWRVEDNRVSLHKTLGTPISGVSYAFGIRFSLYLCASSLFPSLDRLLDFVPFLCRSCFRQKLHQC